MTIRFATIKLSQLRAHLRWWLLYILVTIIMNFIMYGKLNLSGISVLMIPLAGSFYLIEWLLRQYRSRTYFSLVMVLVTLLYFMLVSLFVLVLVYFLLPRMGVILYDPAVPFNGKWFIGNMYRNFSPVLVAAIAYRMFLSYKEQEQVLLAAERALNASLERKVEMDQENKRLKKSLLRGQLGSHLKHNVISLLRQRMAHTPDDHQLVEGLLEMQRYDFTNLDPNCEGVLLENEVQYLQHLISLNRIVHPGAEAVDFQIKRPLLARLVPPFICSTILENALKYGDQHDPQYPIRMLLESGPNELSFLATNKVLPDHPNLGKRPGSSSGIGLENIRRQLDLFKPGRYFFDAAQQGSLYQVRLVIRYDDFKK